MVLESLIKYVKNFEIEKNSKCIKEIKNEIYQKV